MASGSVEPEAIVPQRYRGTALYAHLRLAERFGWGIVAALGEMDELAVRQLIEFDGLRQVEEIREKMVGLGVRQV